MTTLKEKLLHKIDSHELRMKPKRYFVMRLVALAIVAGLVLAVTVFLFNFIFFSMRVSGHAQLFRYGGAGFFVFLKLFPWLLFATDILLVILLEKLLRRFRFAYRQPVLYLFLALFAFGIAAGLFLDRISDVNERLLNHADRDELPGLINNLYRGARRLPPGEFR